MNNDVLKQRKDELIKRKDEKEKQKGFLNWFKQDKVPEKK